MIADTLAVYIDTIYNALPQYTGGPLLAASLMFAIQIYCDFSGYSDIAIDTAHLFGIDLMKNFDSPYFSASVKEFWARWHISLSTWLRDYVYIPLGGNRVSKPRNAFNLMATFFDQRPLARSKLDLCRVGRHPWFRSDYRKIYFQNRYQKTGPAFP